MTRPVIMRRVDELAAGDRILVIGPVEALVERVAPADDWTGHLSVTVSACGEVWTCRMAPARYVRFVDTTTETRAMEAMVTCA